MKPMRDLPGADNKPLLGGLYNQYLRQADELKLLVWKTQKGLATEGDKKRFFVVRDRLLATLDRVSQEVVL